jgi:hypothetical protein
MTDLNKKRRTNSNSSNSSHDLDTKDDWLGPKRDEIEQIEECENVEIRSNDNTYKESQHKKRKSI